jgi:hypothetical protein
VLPPLRRHARGHSAAWPSPIWVNRWFPDRVGDTDAEQRRQRLDDLGVALALDVPLDVAEDAVVDRLLDQAVSHIRRIRDGLAAEASARANS